MPLHNTHHERESAGLRAGRPARHGRVHKRAAQAGDGLGDGLGRLEVDRTALDEQLAAYMPWDAQRAARSGPEDFRDVLALGHNRDDNVLPSDPPDAGRTQFATTSAAFLVGKTGPRCENWPIKLVTASCTTSLMYSTVEGGSLWRRLAAIQKPMAPRPTSVS